jgi:hypothetical protein
VIVTNLNCNGTTFTHLADSNPFTGTLDGHYHTIDNLNIDAYGLFANTSGATIKNLRIASGSLSGSAYLGSFVGQATNTMLQNVHSGMSVAVTGAYGGGLVGSMHGTSSISDSSFSGNFSGTVYTGGLVGAMWDAGTSISDSFVSGTATFGDDYEGAAVGGFFNGTLSRIYSSTVAVSNGNLYDGGLVGDDQGSINDSFSATTMSGTSGSYGGVLGLDLSSVAGGTYSNNYFDETTNNTANCFGSGVPSGCTGVNSGNATPNYFKNNTINGPLGAWDFSTIWATTSGYPTLRSLNDFTDSGLPNSGDANGDGTPDSYQPNIDSIPNLQYVWTTVTVPLSSHCTVGQGEWLDNNAISQDPRYLYPLSTMTGFNLYCDGVGQTVPVTIIYDKKYDTSGWVLRHFDTATHTYATINGAVFGTTTIGGMAKTTVTYNVTDGGVNDSDGVANGVIIDPVGPAKLPPLAPDTGFGRSNTGQTTVVYYALVALIVMSLGASMRRRQDF